MPGSKSLMLMERCDRKLYLYWDGKRKFALTEKSLAAINDDKTSAFKNDRVEIYVNANQDGVNFKNTAKLAINDQPHTSNNVSNRTPSYHPFKKDVDADGNNYNKQNAKPGDTLHYQIIGDLSDFTNVALTPDQINDQTFQLGDNYDETRLEVTDAVKKNLKITLAKDKSKSSATSRSSSSATDNSSNTSSATLPANSQSTGASSATSSSTTMSSQATKNKQDDTILITKGTATKFDMNDVTVNWDTRNGRLSIVPKDQQAFLKKYAGKQLIVDFNPVVKSDATGLIQNTASQITFGKKTPTNKVTNPISEHYTITKTVTTKTLPNTGETGLWQQAVDWVKGLF